VRPAVLLTLFGALIVLAIISTFVVMARASKGYEKARQRRIDRGPRTPCPICRSPMELVGVQEFKLSDQAEGVDAGVAARLGASGTSLPLEVYRCPTCRKLELFLPPSAG
jgi:hypothetical protein